MADRDEAGRFVPGHASPGPGRPSIYDEAHAQTAYEVMRTGLSKTAAAGVIGISRDTFLQWESDHPGFSVAVKLGEAARTLHLEQDLLKAPDGPTVTSRIFALKNAAPDEWRDKQVIDNTSSDGSMSPAKPASLSNLSDQELADLERLTNKARDPEGMGEAD